MKMPYDNMKQLFLEYDNFVPQSHANEETFVPFLNYPIQKNFTYQQKKYTMDTYAQVTKNYNLSLK